MLVEGTCFHIISFPVSGTKPPAAQEATGPCIMPGGYVHSGEEVGVTAKARLRTCRMNCPRD